MRLLASRCRKPDGSFFSARYDFAAEIDLSMVSSIWLTSIRCFDSPGSGEVHETCARSSTFRRDTSFKINPAQFAATKAEDNRPDSTSPNRPNIGVPGCRRGIVDSSAVNRAEQCHDQSYRCLRRTLLNGAAAVLPHNQPAQSADRVQKAWFGLGKALMTAPILPLRLFFSSR